MVFTADYRNLGGRDVIIDRIQRHHNKVIQAKPTMNTRVKPKKHVDFVKSVTRKNSGRKTISMQSQSELFNFPKVIY
jgi:hypothetical protein